MLAVPKLTTLPVPSLASERTHVWVIVTPFMPSASVTEPVYESVSPWRNAVPLALVLAIEIVLTGSTFTGAGVGVDVDVGSVDVNCP